MRKYDIFNDEDYPPKATRFFKFDLNFNIADAKKEEVQHWIKKFNLEDFSSNDVFYGIAHYTISGGCRYEDSDKFENMVYELYTAYGKQLSIVYHLADTVNPILRGDGYIPPNCTNFHLSPKF